jgi:hypothetical protein
MNRLKLLTVKDISNYLEVSLSTAKKYNNDIKNHYKLTTKITESHLEDYFKIPKIKA